METPSGSGFEPFGVSEAFDNSISVRPLPLTRVSASSGEICAAGMRTRSTQLPSMNRGIRGGCAGQ